MSMAIVMLFVLVLIFQNILMTQIAEKLHKYSFLSIIISIKFEISQLLLTEHRRLRPPPPGGASYADVANDDAGH